MRQSTKEAAKGKWDGILQELIGDLVLSRKHGPCPICGGKDRYRYDNRHGNGDWFCNVCGAGDGFDLLEKVQGWDFAEAAQRVDRIVHNIDTTPFQPEVNVEQRRRRLNDLWTKAVSPELVSQYFGSRGLNLDVIDPLLADLRGHPAMWDTDINATRPGIVALVRNQHGTPVTAHRTFLNYLADGSIERVSKKLMPPLESIKGASIRLGNINDRVVLAEGIETALAGAQVTGMPAMAFISANNLAEAEVPESVKGVTICADNDDSYTGQWAAFQCARRLTLQRGCRVEVIMPETAGTDMLDYLLNGGTPMVWGGTK